MAAARHPSAPSPDSDAVLELLQQELCDATCVDRAAKFQMFCEMFWDRLQVDPAPANSAFDRFVAMLQQDDNVLLAQLVIPDLRPNAVPPLNHMKKRAWDSIQSGRISPDCFQQQQQIDNGSGDNDDDTHQLYIQEKQVLHEAELYRACILLYGRGNMDEGQREAVGEWLARYPTESAGN
jgi:hypothetical protein